MQADHQAAARLVREWQASHEGARTLIEYEAQQHTRALLAQNAALVAALENVSAILLREIRKVPRPRVIELGLLRFQVEEALARPEETSHAD